MTDLTLIENWTQGRWHLVPGKFWKTVPQGKGIVLAVNEGNTSGFFSRSGSTPETNVRIVHEIAHLICCPDEHILDPQWGMNVWADRQNIDYASWMKELEVGALEGMIKSRLKMFHSLKTNPNAYHWSQHAFTTPAQTEACFAAARASWTAEAAYAELCRKYALIDYRQHLQVKEYLRLHGLKPRPAKNFDLVLQHKQVQPYTPPKGKQWYNG
jgi:hypothetical protein